MRKLRSGEEGGQRNQRNAGPLRGEIDQDPLGAVVREQAEHARPRLRPRERVGDALYLRVESVGAQHDHVRQPAITLGSCA